MSMRFFVLSLVFVLASIGVSRASPLQQAIDKAPSGAVIALGPGFYEGNIVISKPLTLRASGKGVVIHGDGTGSVITVTASYVTVDGLTIENSGPKHQTVDAGITVRGADNVKILRNRIRDCRKDCDGRSDLTIFFEGYIIFLGE